MNWLIYAVTIFLVVDVLAVVAYSIWQAQKDKKADYEAMPIEQFAGKVKKTGKQQYLYLFATSPMQPRKKQAILQKMETIQELQSSNGKRYLVTRLFSDNYWLTRASQSIGKRGPYIAYSVLPLE